MKKLFLFAIAVLLVCGCTDSGIDETPYGGSDNTENPATVTTRRMKNRTFRNIRSTEACRKGSSSKALSSLSRS